MKTKVVTVCGRGNVRSVALGYILKDKYGLDSVAIGCNSAGTDLIDILYRWADVVIYMTYAAERDMPQHDLHGSLKMTCEVGEDVFGNPRHQTLLAKCEEWLTGNIDTILNHRKPR